MKEVYEAIVTAFDADPDLSSMFPNGLFHDSGYDKEPLPVCIVAGISDVASWTTCQEITDLRIQFTVFTTTDTESFDAVDNIKAVFDDINLSLTNATPIRVTRLSVIPPRRFDPDVWRTVVEYRIQTTI